MLIVPEIKQSGWAGVFLNRGTPRFVLDKKYVARVSGQNEGVGIIISETVWSGLVLASLLIIALVVIVVPVSAGTPSVTISPSGSSSTDLNNINNAISTAGAGGTVILNPGTYYLSDVDVSNNIAIQANTSYGHGPLDTIIDGRYGGWYSIFTESSGYSLIIDNLTIQNGDIYIGGRGGAIYATGNVTITSSTFTECSVNNNNGGAIYTTGNVMVTSSTFTKCSAGDFSGGGGNSFGGAIYAGGNVTVISSTFTECSASDDSGDSYGDSFGGAIYATGNVTVTSSTFTECSASSSSRDFTAGGVIYAGGSVTVTSSTFTGCSASDNLYNYGDSFGGAIYATGNVTVISSTFNECSASSSGPGSNGGAIFVSSSGSVTVTVTSSTFTDCSANSSGISNGGAIYANSYRGIVTITSSTFTGCSASDSSGLDRSEGGAIYASSGTIQFCRIYQDNTGTAVINGGGSLDAPDNWWGTNSGPSSSDIGGFGITATSWLVLGISASPSTITTGGTSTITANLACNSNGVCYNPAPNQVVPDGIPFTYSVSGIFGTFQPSAGNMTSGANTTVFHLGSAGTGTGTVSVTVDGQTVTVPITVTLATTPLSSVTLSSNTPVEGTQLTTTLAPAGATATYTWYNCTDAAGDGAIVVQSSSTTSTYTPTATDVGKWINVTAVGSGSSTGTVFASTMNAVSAPAPTPTPTPASSGGGQGSRTDYWVSSGSSDQGYTGPEPTVMGYNPTPAQPTGTPAVAPQGQQVAGSDQVVVQQTVAAPPAASTGPPWGGIPVVPAVAALAGIGVIGGGGLLARRWWIRRQNPALFRKYD